MSVATRCSRIAIVLLTMLQHHGASQPAIYASFQPLSHMAERIMVPCMMIAGGRIGFVSPGNAELFREVKTIQPSVINSVPAFFNKIYNEYREALATALKGQPEQLHDALKQQVMAVYSQCLGACRLLSCVLLLLSACSRVSWFCSHRQATTWASYPLAAHLPILPPPHG